MKMTKQPKVSIYLSSYNHAAFLRESIDSVLNQTYDDFELIILDDASTDNSWEIIQSYNDPRLRSIRNSYNHESRFSSIFADIKGEYIAIHHSDDVWQTDKLEKQTDFLDSHPEIGAVFSLVEVIDENSKPVPDHLNYLKGVFNQKNRDRFAWLRHFFFNQNCLCHPSVLIRRECYENCGLYRLGLSQLADFDMWVRLCLQYEIHILQEELVKFRILSNYRNASSPKIENRIRENFEYLQIYRNFLQLTDADEFLQVFPEAIKYKNGDWFEPAYALAMLALADSNLPPKQLFGEQILFDLLNDPNKKLELKRFADFQASDFKKITGKTDVFFYEARSKFYRFHSSWMANIMKWVLSFKSEISRFKH